MDKKQTVRAYIMELPEPYRTRVITESMWQFKNVRLDQREVFNRYEAVNISMDWNSTSERYNHWKDIYYGLKADPEYLHKRVLKEGHTPESTPEAHASITQDTDMKNGTYAIAKLIAKTEKELAANKAAVVKFNADAASRKQVIDAIKAQLKLSPAAPAPEGCTAEVTSVTLKFTGPKVTNWSDKLEGILTKLSNLSGTEIGWNEEIEFVLSDFSGANGSRTKTVDVTVTAEK